MWSPCFRFSTLSYWKGLGCDRCGRWYPRSKRFLVCVVLVQKAGVLHLPFLFLFFAWLLLLIRFCDPFEYYF
jgi:hypothetical protein